jgi:hypothetical protein
MRDAVVVCELLEGDLQGHLRQDAGGLLGADGEHLVA